MDEEAVDLGAGDRCHIWRRHFGNPRIANEAGEARDPEVPIEWIEGDASAVAYGRDVRAARHTGRDQRVASDRAIRVQFRPPKTGLVSPVERAEVPRARLVQFRVE